MNKFKKEKIYNQLYVHSDDWKDVETTKDPVKINVLNSYTVYNYKQLGEYMLVLSSLIKL